MVRALDRGSLQIGESEEALKRMPRGFEAQSESPIAKYFRSPSFMVSETLSDEDVMSDGLIELIVAFVKRAKPLLDYGWSVLPA